MVWVMTSADKRILDAKYVGAEIKGFDQTINGAGHDVSRRHLLEDFDVVRDVDGTPREVAAGRMRDSSTRSSSASVL
jgi:hypothetical protein